MSPRLLLLAVLALAVAGAKQPKVPVDTLLGSIQAQSDLKFVANAIRALNLEAELSDPAATVTLFAPVDKAWKAYCAELGVTPLQLLGDYKLLFNTLFGHVVRPLGKDAAMSPGLLLPLVITKRSAAQALPAGKPANLRVRSVKPALVIAGTTNSAKVVRSNIPAGKSIIHKIDTVIRPSRS